MKPRRRKLAYKLAMPGDPGTLFWVPKKREPDTFDLGQLAKLFELPDVDDLIESNWENFAEHSHHAYEAAISEGYTEDEAQAAGEKAEREAMDDFVYVWRRAVLGAIEPVLEEHGLAFMEKRGFYRVFPVKSWGHAAAEVMNTINGVGSFEFRNLREFLSSGPYTARQAVLTHLHWLKRRADVYGTMSAERRYEIAMERI